MSKDKKYYQPNLPEKLWGTNEGIYSFEVYRSKENCISDFPEYEALEYSGNDIEEPTFID